jgi:hypothetical protein
MEPHTCLKCIDRPNPAQPDGHRIVLLFVVNIDRPGARSPVGI